MSFGNDLWMSYIHMRIIMRICVSLHIHEWLEIFLATFIAECFIDFHWNNSMCYVKQKILYAFIFLLFYSILLINQKLTNGKLMCRKNEISVALESLLFCSTHIFCVMRLKTHYCLRFSFYISIKQKHLQSLTSSYVTT